MRRALVRIAVAGVMWGAVALTGNTVVLACSAFCAVGAGQVLVGNNEDWNNPRTKIRFVPAKPGSYGRVYVGFDDLRPQGGMNEHGLWFDGLSADRSNTPRVALVSAALADRFLSGNAVGQRLLINDNNEGPRPIEIVGVVENVRQAALDLPPALDVYIPLRQVHPDGVAALRNNQFWMARLRSHDGPGASARQVYSDPAAFRATFLAHLRAVDPDAAVSGTGTMRQHLDAWLGPRRFNLGLFGAFALSAVLLAVSGLYGLVAYAVSQRAPEIGLRMAIGATQGDVQRMILRQAAGLGVTGAAVGLGLAAAARPLISGMVQDVRIGPAVVAATAALLIAVVLIAAWVPARRAARIEPTLALRGW